MSTAHARRLGPPGPRRAEILAALSLAIDVGLGQPLEHVLRTSLLATALADRLGLDARRRGVAYYAALVAWIGCHADSHELSAWFGDDIAFRADAYGVDWSGPRFAALLARHVGQQHAVVERSRVAARFLRNPRDHITALIQSHCSSAAALADDIGLGDAVGAVIACSFERWDGSGLPAGLRAGEIPLEMRIVHVADVAEVHLAGGGLDAVRTLLRDRRGRQFDPDVVAAFERDLESLVARVAVDDAWDAALREAPDRDMRVDSAELDELLGAIGDFVDLKVPARAGHSRGVADLAAAGGDVYGLGADAVRTIYRAGLVHDVGRMGVANSVWEKPGPLGTAELERVRMYPYLTGRILRRVAGLERVAHIAASHAERLDGSGYPSVVTASSLSIETRLLAAADVYRALREPRPYRSAMAATDAAAVLRDEARYGHLDDRAVEAVLTAAGHTATARTSLRPAGLTRREIEVIRLLARGAPHRSIAASLGIAEKTARNHVQRIYTKIDVTNRTGASLFALRHGLVDLPDTS